MTDLIVQLSNITKRWGNFVALDNISLDVHRGEILTLLGPSGCGKTTLMRIVAGFERQSEGVVRLDGSDISGKAPERRPVNMVFQRYALFPHLDVYDNVAFGLRLKGLSNDQVKKKVEAMLHLVQLETFASRWIGEISGGQAQRVALARALVNSPSVLLLDEPLAALDLKIRHHMLDELKRIHEETGTTFIYVTHDQDEAMILSDRVVLLNKGRIEQIGAPDEMYGAPKTLFCARFFGETNIVAGTVADRSGEDVVVDTPLCRVRAGAGTVAKGDGVHVSIRPEAVRIELSPDKSSDGANLALGVVDDVTFIGSRVSYKVRVPSGDLIKCQEPRTAAGIRFHKGSSVALSWDSASPVVLPA